MSVEQSAPDEVEGLLRPAAIGHVLEELQHAAGSRPWVVF